MVQLVYDLEMHLDQPKVVVDQTEDNLHHHSAEEYELAFQAEGSNDNLVHHPNLNQQIHRVENLMIFNKQTYRQLTYPGETEPQHGYRS